MKARVILIGEGIDSNASPVPGAGMNKFVVIEEDADMGRIFALLGAKEDASCRQFVLVDLRPFMELFPCCSRKPDVEFGIDLLHKTGTIYTGGKITAQLIWRSEVSLRYAESSRSDPTAAGTETP